MSDEKIIKLPRRMAAAPPADRDRLIVVAQSECHHVHTEVDPELLELRCRDCRAMLNPITFIVRIAEVWRLRDEQHQRSLKALEANRRDLDQRRRCRCEYCGRTTTIRRVSDRELKRIREKPPID